MEYKLRTRPGVLASSYQDIASGQHIASGQQITPAETINPEAQDGSFVCRYRASHDALAYLDNNTSKAYPMLVSPAVPTPLRYNS